MKTKMLITLVMLSSYVHAGTISKHTVCPNVTTEGQNLVSKIQNLASKLKQKPECTPIADHLSNVNSIISNDTWKNFKEIVTGSESVSLEGEEIEELRGLTESVSDSISQTVAMLTGNSNCVAPKDKAGFLSTIAGVTKEVSNIVGAATGPYGMAVSLGGNLLSGAISGVNNFFKSRSLYNFYDTEEELLFMNQFCSFTEVKKDVADFLGMERRPEELATLKKYLLIKEQSLVENCPLCGAYKDVWDTKIKADKVISRIIKLADINEIPENPEDRSAFSRCTEISRAVYTSNSDLKQFFNVLRDYQVKLNQIKDVKIINLTKTDNELIGMLLEVEKILPDMFPSMNECLLSSEDEQMMNSRKFNLLIRDELVPQNEKIFYRLQKTFEVLADKKYAKPLGQYIALTKERLVWVEKHSRVIKKQVEDPNRSDDTQKIAESHEKLEDRIISSLMPAYLNFSIKRNKKYINKFRVDLNNFRIKQLKRYKNAFDMPVDTIAELTEQLKTSTVIDARIYLSEQRKIFDKLVIALDQTKNFKRYCEYLKYTSSMVGRNTTYCAKGGKSIAYAYSLLGKYHADIKVMHGFNSWADGNLDIQSSRVLDYAQHIRTWTELANQRWDLYTPTKPPTDAAENARQEIDDWLEGNPFELSSES